jgi:hypothetical protein
MIVELQTGVVVTFVVALPELVVHGCNIINNR